MSAMTMDLMTPTFGAPLAPQTYYVVKLVFNGFWLGTNRHWLPDGADAHRFPSYAEAAEAAEGYDVEITMVEPPA